MPAVKRKTHGASDDVTLGVVCGVDDRHEASQKSELHAAAVLDPKIELYCGWTSSELWVKKTTLLS